MKCKEFEVDCELFECDLRYCPMLLAWEESQNIFKPDFDMNDK